MLRWTPSHAGCSILPWSWRVMRSAMVSMFRPLRYGSRRHTHWLRRHSVFNPWRGGAYTKMPFSARNVEISARILLRRHGTGALRRAEDQVRRMERLQAHEAAATWRQLA